MKKITSAALLVIALGACNTTPKFEVEGHITDAKGKTLYLEASGLDGIQILDSVKLKDNGSFSFKESKPESPEFYRLRVDDKVINFSVDSTETIIFNAPYGEFATGYNVEGSIYSQEIKELTLKQAELQDKVNALLTAMRSTHIVYPIIEDSLSTLM